MGIWLNPAIEAPISVGEISDEENHKILDAKRKDYAQKEKPVLDILKSKNINIKYASQYAPLIYAEVPAKLMAEIENIPEVDGVYLAKQFKPALNMVAQTVKVQPVWSAGIMGSGIKVAVVEKGRFTTENPYLTPGPSYKTAGPDSHATQVAGIIASTHPTYKGISYGVPAILSANAGSWSESDMIAASEWAITNGANILTNSWGDDTGLVMRGIDRYYDHVVWENRKTVTVVSGNEGQTSGNVVSPGLAYNIITVGGFDDKDSSEWLDDTMWAGSSYKDPTSPHMDREKPEVIAVATHGSRYITSTHIANPWVYVVVGAGTSYAAPAVAAEAALLMQTKSWLTLWPETVKAAIMASAVHNIEGSSMLSEYDGAGGIDISNAYYTVNNNRISGEMLLASNFPKDYTFTASAGQKVRVAIAWDSHPDSNHPPTSDTLVSDLDLYILDPNGNTVAFSSSYDNSYEIVEFTARTTGTFKARIKKYGSASYEYLGFAYTYA
ncbi:MAG: S8 family serine peptidase [Candidatus Methanoperedens sp.]|nr:S8 family serine peptidase [Candidatus Methanoperedens sp.]